MIMDYLTAILCFVASGFMSMWAYRLGYRTGVNHGLERAEFQRMREAQERSSQQLYELLKIP
jgi:hypothetical protein